MRRRVPLIFSERVVAPSVIRWHNPFVSLAFAGCEVFVRLRAVGLTNGQAYKLPITQAELGGATGLSTVHLNRTLQELRGNGLITTPKGSHVMIEDWDGLQKAGEFDPTYLHIKKA